MTVAVGLFIVIDAGNLFANLRANPNVQINHHYKTRTGNTDQP